MSGDKDIDWLDSQVVGSSIVEIDHYLVGVRWAVIFAAGLFSLLVALPGNVLLSPIVVFTAVALYNVPLSIYIWRKRPIAAGHVGWLLLCDLAQLPLILAVSGGYHSFYFMFSLLIFVEIALVFHWRVVVVGIVSIAALQIVAEVIPLSFPLDVIAAYMIAGKFVISLVVGGLVILFSEMMRRENALRLQAAQSASRLTALNTLLTQLERGALDLKQTLKTILDSVQTVPGVGYSLILMSDSAADEWSVAASTSERIPVGTEVPIPEKRPSGTQFFSLDPSGFGLSSSTTAEQWAAKLSGVFLYSPDGVTLGELVFGRSTNRALSESDQAFLHSLALDAGLALSNARLYAQQREQVVRLQHFEFLQTTFFSAIGHEFKTPLAVLKMLVPSLEQWCGLAEPTRDEIRESMEYNVGRLETLTFDLLEGARLEAGAVTLHPQTMSLAPLIRRAADNIAPLLARKKQHAQISVASDLPLVNVDSRRFEQIMSNLLGNAAKFAPADSEIKVSATQQGDAIQIGVADGGPGVSVEERERIFDRFYIAEGAKAPAGAGLGLFIARELVQLHGGYIWVEDCPEGGSCFRFTLPLPDEDEIDAEID